MLSKIIKKE